VFFWVTAVFAAFELCSSFFSWNWKNSWSPHALPVVGAHSPAVSRTESVAQILFGAAFIVWWQAIPQAPFLLLGPAARIIAPAPIWTDLHWPILFLAAAGIAQACLDLARPQQTKWRVKIRLAIQAAGLILLCLLLRAGVWVVMAPGVQNTDRYSGVVGVLNQILFYCLLVGLIIEGVRFVWRCLRQFQAHTAIHAAALARD
jgi:hypothetical protein